VVHADRARAADMPALAVLPLAAVLLAPRPSRRPPPRPRSIVRVRLPLAARPRVPRPDASAPSALDEP
jgi:hypothetical protein